MKQTPPTTAPRRPRRRQAQKIASLGGSGARKKVDGGQAVFELAGREPAPLIDAEPTKKGDVGRRTSEADAPDPPHSRAMVGSRTTGSTVTMTGHSASFRTFNVRRASLCGRSVIVVPVVGPFARALRDRPDPSLPLPAGPVSNGEFIPAAADAVSRATNDLIRSTADDAARRLGVDRRRFLQSAGAVVASLAAFELAGCAGAAPSGRSTKTTGSGRGGTFGTTSPVDADACHETLATKASSSSTPTPIT